MGSLKRLRMKSTPVCICLILFASFAANEASRIHQETTSITHTFLIKEDSEDAKPVALFSTNEALKDMSLKNIWGANAINIDIRPYRWAEPKYLMCIYPK